MYTQMIEVTALEKSPQNVRKNVPKQAAQDLKASIFAHGLLQNLVVTKAGADKYRVIAGGRRLAALRELQKEGHLPAHHAVACQVAEDDNATELSLVENIVRLAMHPADEFEAFVKLIEQGQSAAEIAERFGTTEKHVLKRLSLGKLAPMLLLEYRNEKLTLDALMAFTVTDDHDLQIEVYNRLEEWELEEPSNIRSALTETMIDAKDSLALFVGVNAYTEAGGTTRTDLFGEDVYLENPDLLHQLADQKLSQLKAEIEAEGWAWVKVSVERDYSEIYRYSRISPQPINVPQDILDSRDALEQEISAIEQALEDTESDELMDALDSATERLGNIEASIATFTCFDSEQIKRAGCYVSIARNGTPDIERGLISKEDAMTMDATSDDETIKPAIAKDALSGKLRDDLAAIRLAAAKVEVATHPQAASDLITYSLAESLLGTAAIAGLNLQLIKPREKRLEGLNTEKAQDALHTVRESLSLTWMQEQDKAKRFSQFSALPEKDKGDILAFCVAAIMQPQLRTHHEETTYEQALATTGGDMASYWRPTKSNFFGRVRRDYLLDICSKAFGTAWTDARKGEKKSALADRLEKAFAEPQKHAKTPEQLAFLKTWLPDGMRISESTKPSLVMIDCKEAA